MNTAAPKTEIAHTGLLVSVSNRDEAAAAMAGGADWIDLKDPQAGALGAVGYHAATEVAQFVGSSHPLSAALGESQTWRNTPAPQLLDVPEISYVKLGLSGCGNKSNWQSTWKQTDTELTALGKSLVAVAYADWQTASAPAPEEVVALAAQSAARCLLIDTFDKRAGGTLECLDENSLLKLIQQARSQDLKLVLAGKLQLACIRQLPLSKIDLIAVRSAACPTGRDSSVDRNLVASLKAALRRRD